MRKFLTLATESHVDPVFQNLSLEEEQDLLVEATSDQAQVANDLAEVERIGDMSDALEDLAVVADGMGEDGPTDTEAALVDTMANMAVAGTDVEASEIVPAMESYASGKRLRYSAESIRERAKAIWESIRKFLKQIWDKITSFFYKIFGTIPALRRRVEALKKQVDDNGRRTIDAKKITISTGVASLSVDYKTPKDDAELRKHFNHFAGVVKEVYTHIADNGLKLGEIILHGLDNFDAEKPADSCTDFLEKVSKQVNQGKPQGAKAVGGKRFGDDMNAYMSEPLMGNISLVLIEPKDSELKKGQSVTVHYLEKWRKSACEIVQTNEKAKDAPASFEMATASNSNMDGLLETALEILDELEKFQRGKRANEMKTLRGKMETASDRLAKEMDKLAGSDEKAERDSVPYYRAMVNYNGAFARWMKDPAMPMVSHSLASIRGVMNVVQKSLSAYK